MSKRLLVLDVEGTLFETKFKIPGTDLDLTVWQAIAVMLGPGAVSEEVESHRKWQTGKYPSYIDWMKDTIKIHKRHGLSKSVFDQIVASAGYNEGVVETFAEIDRDLFEPVLVTGGFADLAIRANRDLGIAHTFAACEYFFDAKGKLSAFNLLPCDFEGKLDFIRLMLREYGLSDRDWVFVGDGGNDVPIAKMAPVAIGYRPHPKLREVVHHTVFHFKEVLAILTKIPQYAK